MAIISGVYEAMPMVDSPDTTLRAMGKDETWLHHWIVEKPSRLGLEELTITHAELTPSQNQGDRLDMLTRAIEQGDRQVMAKALTSGKVRVNMGDQSRLPAHAIPAPMSATGGLCHDRPHSTGHP